MPKVEVIFYTNVLFVGTEETYQQSFTVEIDTYKNNTNADIGNYIVNFLEDTPFIASEVGSHFYKTSTITDFHIKKIESTEPIKEEKTE